jgi:hypothetical protein
MKCDMDFKFGMGAAVRVRIGKYVAEGIVTARIEAGVHPHYRIQIGNGNEFQVSEKHMWIVSCVPGWLHPGAMVQWVGEGLHEIYVVKALHRGKKNRPWTFTAERELFLLDGIPYGREKTFTECTPANMASWRPWQEKKPSGKDGPPGEGTDNHTSPTVR